MGKVVSKDQENKILYLHEHSELRVVDIAAEMDLHHSTISNVIKKYKVHKRERRYCEAYKNKINTLADRNKKIIALYVEGMNGVELAKEFNIGKSVVYKVLKKNGITRNSSQVKYKKFDVSDNDLIKLYETHSLSEISEKSGIPKETVRRHLLSNKIEMKDNRDYIHSLEDVDYFECINTEQKAYLLGLIAADGNIVNGQIRLGLTDKELIDKYVSAIGWSGPVTFMPAHTYESNGKIYNHSDTWIVAIGSVKMIKDLSKLGIAERKTYHLDFPPIEAKFYSHFIRGFFDGDGCIHVSGINKPRTWPNGVPTFSIVGLKGILLKIQEILIDNCVVNKNKLINHECSIDDLKYLAYSRSQAIKIRNFIYKDATIYLNRKFDKFYSVEIPVFTGFKIKEFADKYGISEKTTRYWVNSGSLKSIKEHGITVIPIKAAVSYMNFISNTVQVKDVLNITGASASMMNQILRKCDIKTWTHISFTRIYLSEITKIQEEVNRRKAKNLKNNNE